MIDLLQNPALWIALAAAALVIVAHGVLFWWFLCRMGLLLRRRVRRKAQAVCWFPGGLERRSKTSFIRAFGDSHVSNRQEIPSEWSARLRLSCPRCKLLMAPSRRSLHGLAPLRKKPIGDSGIEVCI